MILTAYALIAAGYGEALSDLGLGEAAGIAGSGAAGGALLSSLGTWIDSGGVAIAGGVGGAAAGLGAGKAYADAHPVSAGQGLLYASGVGWGLAGGILATDAIFGPRSLYASPLTARQEDRRQDVGALLRDAGALGGAGLTFALRDRDPRPAAVLEGDLYGYLGARIGAELVDVSRIGVSEESCLIYPIDNRLVSPNIEDCQDYRRWARARAGAALAGGGLALAGYALSPAAGAPDQASLGLRAVGIAEGAWLGGWLPVALDLDPEDEDSAVLLGSHGGAAAGLLLASLPEPSPAQAALSGWGALLGNALGAGVPLMLDQSGPRVARPMLAAGLGGALAGGLAGDAVSLSPEDRALVGLGAPLVALGAGIISDLAMDPQREQVTWSPQTEGLALTAGAAAGVGLTALAAGPEPLRRPRPKAALPPALRRGLPGEWGVQVLPLAGDGLYAAVQVTGL